MSDLQEQGIKAINQDFKRYDQVNKEQSYNLVENKETDPFDHQYQIKTCDMTPFFQGGSAGKKHFAQQLGSALEDIGFAILTNHGVNPELYTKATEKIAQFFTQTTQKQRLAYRAQRQGAVNQGYFPVKETTMIHPDMVEGWVFCRRAFNMDNDKAFDERAFWPLAGFEPLFREICQSQQQLILPIMQSLLAYLGVDPHCYDKKLSTCNFGFRLNYYPPINQHQINSGAGRMLGHEDVDLFTLLPAANIDGLQVLNRHNMKWIHLNPPANSIILNTGDYMQRISNDRLPSTTHRVSQPRQQSHFSKVRISFPMAIYVHEEEMLEVLPGLGEAKYPPIKALEFHTKTTSKYYGDDYAVS